MIGRAWIAERTPVRAPLRNRIPRTAAILATPLVAIGAAATVGLPVSSAGTIVLMLAMAVGVAWRTRPGRGIKIGGSTYPARVNAAVAGAAITGFRDDRFHNWLVRFGGDGSERRMTEPEFQDLVRTASPDREIAAVQQVGTVIYVQHISDGTLNARKHRTQTFYAD